MITALLLQAALGQLPRQVLPATGCAAFLWSRGEPPQLVAMVSADAATLRLQLDGKTVELARTAAEGAAGRGFPTSARYAAGDATATVSLAVEERPDLADGALVPEATVTLERPGRDTAIVPTGGMIGCARPR